jgi:hypothetical protein
MIQYSHANIMYGQWPYIYQYNGIQTIHNFAMLPIQELEGTWEEILNFLSTGLENRASYKDLLDFEASLD